LAGIAAVLERIPPPGLPYRQPDHEEFTMTNYVEAESVSRHCHTPREFWSRHREASLNWLALGLLLAAWNASDQEAPNHATHPELSLIGKKSSVSMLPEIDVHRGHGD
jgi:hypothetical protein